MPGIGATKRGLLLGGVGMDVCGGGGSLRGCAGGGEEAYVGAVTERVLTGLGEARACVASTASMVS